MLSRRARGAAAVALLALLGACGGDEKASTQASTTSAPVTPGAPAPAPTPAPAPLPTGRPVARLILPAAGAGGQTVEIPLLSYDAGISNTGGTVAYAPFLATVDTMVDAAIVPVVSDLPAARVVSAATAANGQPLVVYELTNVTPSHAIEPGHIALSYVQLKLTVAGQGAPATYCWKIGTGSC